MKHTPGPWERDADNDVVVTVLGRVLRLAKVSGGSPQEWIDNANLIAASPDLLAALRDIVANIDKGGCPVRGSVMHETGRAAIAKAEGKA